MILTFDLETWFVFTAHLSLKGPLGVKYETSWKKWIEYIVWTKIFHIIMSALTVTFDSELGLKSLHTLYFKAVHG